jgi:hypothetical protein
MMLPRLAALAALLALLPLRADVFWRLPDRSDATLRQLGGNRIYSTDVEVNGSPGTLAAYAFDSAPAAVRSRLARTLGLPAGGTAANAALLTQAQHGRLRHLLVLPAPAGADASLVLAFDQSLRAAAARQARPPWPAGMPAFAAEPRFTAVCTQTRTTFVAAASDAPPAAAVQDAARLLLDAGWTETAPTADTFKLFVAGRKQCVLFADRPQQSEPTLISLLQREGATP